MEENEKELTAEELAHLIDRTGRADTFNEWENSIYSRALCEMAGLVKEFDEADQSGADYDDIVSKAAEKLGVYAIIYGEEADT